MWILAVIFLGLSIVSTVVILSALLLSSSSRQTEVDRVERYIGTESLANAFAE